MNIEEILKALQQQAAGASDAHALMAETVTSRSKSERVSEDDQISQSA